MLHDNDALRLFPTPRHLETSAGPGADATTTVDIRFDTAVKSQGYRIQTSATQVSITVSDQAGLRYALQTWSQIVAHPNCAESNYVIADSPDFDRRGFMLDASRDRVPTRQTLIRLLDLAEQSRINHFELYVEHTFAWEAHDRVWQDSSAFSKEDIRWLDRQCRQRGIDLVLSLNCFGHMARWLEHDEYRDRAESPQGFQHGREFRAPATLEPTIENADFVSSLIVEAASCTSSNRVNIGADEPFELGLGKSRDLVNRLGKSRVYFDYVKRVITNVQAAGFVVEFWADIFADHPELMGEVPAGAIPVVWQYDSPELCATAIDQALPEEIDHWRAIGFDYEATREGFAGRARNLISAGIPFWVAPGTSTWQSFTGRLENAVQNIDDAALVGTQQAAQGLITTCWGDHGMFEPPAFAFLPLLLSGAIAWNRDNNSDLDPVHLTNDLITLDPTCASGEALVLASTAAALLGFEPMNVSPAFAILLNGGDYPAGHWPEPADIAAAERQWNRALELLEAADPACSDSSVLRFEMATAIRWALLGCDLLAAGPGGLTALHAVDAHRLLVRFDRLSEDQAQAWLSRARPGGLRDSLDRFKETRRLLARRAAGN